VLLERMKLIAASNRTQILEEIPAEDLLTATNVLEQIATRLEKMGNDENG